MKYIFCPIFRYNQFYYKITLFYYEISCMNHYEIRYVYRKILLFLAIDNVIVK